MGNVASEYKDDCRPFMRRPCQLTMQNCMDNLSVEVTEAECFNLVQGSLTFNEIYLAI